MEDLDEEAVKGNDEAPEEKLNGCNPPVPASAGPSSVPAGNAQRSSLGFQPEGLGTPSFPPDLHWRRAGRTHAAGRGQAVYRSIQESGIQAVYRSIQESGIQESVRPRANTGTPRARISPYAQSGRPVPSDGMQRTPKAVCTVCIRHPCPAGQKPSTTKVRG